MKHFTLLLALFCCGGLSLLTSCSPDSLGSDFTEPDEIVIPDRDPDAVRNGYVITGSEYPLNHGYTVSTTRNDGRYFHYFILTDTDVLGPDGGLTGRSDAVAITLVGGQTLEAGDYPVSTRSPGTAQIGQAIQLELLADQDFGEGSVGVPGLISRASVNVSYSGERIQLRWSGSMYGEETSGSYSGDLQPLNYDAPAVADDHLSGLPAGLEFYEETTPLSIAYLEKVTPASYLLTNHYRLTLCENEVHEDDRLTGTTDMIQLTFALAGDLKDGVYTYDYEEQDYLGWILGGQTGTWYCSNMNFSTNRADDDVPAPRGRTTLRINDGTAEIGFDYTTSTGAAIRGSYVGPLVHINE